MVALSVSMSPSLVERDLLAVVVAAVEEDSMHPERKMLSYMLVT